MSSIAQTPPLLTPRKLLVASLGIHALLLIAPLKYELSSKLMIQAPSSLSVVLQTATTQPLTAAPPLPKPASAAKALPAETIQQRAVPVPPKEVPVSTAQQTRDVETSDFKEYVDPRYPRLAVRQGLEGGVTLAMWALDGMKVSKVEILESSGYPILDEAARTAALKWVLTRPISAATRLTKKVIFRIEN